MIKDLEQLSFHKCSNMEQWHKERRISATRASSIMGENAYLSNVDTWSIITNKRKETDLEGNPNVQFGLNAEKHIRALFALEAKGVYDVIDPYEFEKDGFRAVYYNKERPYLTASIDGLVVDKTNGNIGVLEIKTANILSAQHRENWKDGIPQNYYYQVLHQLLVLGVDYALLVAYLRYSDYSIMKVYKIVREEKKDDLDKLLAEEEKFYKDYVLTNKKPPLLINV